MVSNALAGPSDHSPWATGGMAETSPGSRAAGWHPVGKGVKVGAGVGVSATVGMGKGVGGTDVAVGTRVAVEVTAAPLQAASRVASRIKAGSNFFKVNYLSIKPRPAGPGRPGASPIVLSRVSAWHR